MRETEAVAATSQTNRMSNLPVEPHQPGSPRQPLSWRAILRAALLLFVLGAFASVQSAIAADSHEFHPGNHSHSCAVCHAGHSAAHSTVSNFKVTAPNTVRLSVSAEEPQLPGQPYSAFSSSRAPPCLL